MIDQGIIKHQLAAILDQHMEAIATTWAEMTYQHAQRRPSSGWLDILQISTRRGLRAMIEALSTETFDSLKNYLYDLSIGCLRSGFENGEAAESILRCKDAILSVIRRSTFDVETVWALNAELDACLRWMTGYFTGIYTAEMNQRLRSQRQQIASMLRLAELNPHSVDLDLVLQHVAEGVMASAEVNHCDFYLVDNFQNRMIPRVGISKIPPPPEAVHHFLERIPDPTKDGFYRELMERKTVLVCDNTQTDPRVDHDMIGLTGAKSVLAVPLVANDKVLAIAVTGTFDAYRAFTEEQIELAWDVVRAAALVIENARLNQQNRHMAALEERERLAREIHDNLAQALSILKLQASNIDDLLRNGQTERARVFLTEMTHTATDAHADAREAIFSLRNSAPSASEFLPTLHSFLDKYHRLYGLETNLVSADEDAAILPTTVVTQLTRIIQEALANVRKHAHASAVWVRLEQQQDLFTVTIEDNGRGFDAHQVFTEDCGGVGLHIMRERAESLSGRLMVEAQPGAGTRIIAQIPLSGTISGSD